MHPGYYVTLGCFVRHTSHPLGIPLGAAEARASIPLP